MTNLDHRSAHLNLLDNLPIQSTKHFGRPLREHLIGTYKLLELWGASKSVCLAGLFHSVYGTKTFRETTLPTDSREFVRELIGEHAERLVFIFGMSDRKSLLLHNQSSPYSWVDYRTREQKTLTGVVLKDLVEIEVANFLEQLPHGAVLSDTVMLDMQHRFESAEHLMSVNAMQAYRRDLPDTQLR